MPAAAPLPPVIWKVFPMATAMGWPLKFPNHPRVSELPVRSNDKIDHAAVAVADWVVSGTPTADPADDVVDAPSEVNPPAAYPVPFTISVPAADAELAVEFSRSFIAVVPSGVPSAVPGMPAAPVGVSALRMRDTRVWSIALAIYVSSLAPADASVTVCGPAATTSPSEQVQGRVRDRLRARVHHVPVRVQHPPALVRFPRRQHDPRHAHQVHPGLLTCAARCRWRSAARTRSEEHTSELQSRGHL